MRLNQTFIESLVPNSLGEFDRALQRLLHAFFEVDFAQTRG